MLISYTPKLTGYADPAGASRKMEKLAIICRLCLKFKGPNISSKKGFWKNLLLFPTQTTERPPNFVVLFCLFVSKKHNCWWTDKDTVDLWNWIQIFRAGLLRAKIYAERAHMVTQTFQELTISPEYILLDLLEVFVMSSDYSPPNKHCITILEERQYNCIRRTSSTTNKENCQCVQLQWQPLQIQSTKRVSFSFKVLVSSGIAHHYFIYVMFLF